MPSTPSIAGDQKEIAASLPKSAGHANSVKRVTRASVGWAVAGFCLLVWVAESFAAGNVYPLSPKDQNQLAALGAGVVVDEIEAPLITEPTRYYRPIPGTWQYRITAGDKSGQLRRNANSNTDKCAGSHLEAEPSAIR